MLSKFFICDLHAISNDHDGPVDGELAEVECLPGKVPRVLPWLLLLLLLLATLHEPEARQGDLEISQHCSFQIQLTLQPMLLPDKKT